MSPGPDAPDGFAEFYAAERVRLVLFLLKMGAGWEDARDIAQDAFVHALLRWQDVQDPRTWIRTTAMRAYRRNRSRAAQEVKRAVRGGWLPGPCFANLEQAEECRRVYEAISSLPDRQRQVMAWYYDGYRPHEIAELFKISKDAVRASLYQAKRQLRRNLGPPSEQGDNK